MTRIEFFQGNVASAEGALAAGCRFFGGYPITPSTEVAEHMALRLPKVQDGCFIQMEDEIAGIAAVIGASWTGVRAMTATSGPGFSLMMENIGYAIMTETPCVIVNIQRGGPSTGQPTMASQGDMMQCRYGSHGDISVIALSPASVQECFELTVKAFNLADQFRTPVFLMADEVIGHMRERVLIPDSVPFTGRKPTREGIFPFQPDEDLIPGFAPFGSGHRIPVTGLTHDWRGYPATTNPDMHTELVTRLVSKVEDKRDEIADYEVENRDASVIFISYGAPARTVAQVLHNRKQEGRSDIGSLRLRMVWPFSEKLLDLFPYASVFIIPELNLGMISREVQRHTTVPIRSVSKIGGGLHTPMELLRVAEEYL